MNKKGQMAEMGALATGIAALAITLVVAFLVMSQGKENISGLITATTYNNATVSLPNATTTCFSNCVANNDMTVNKITNCSGIGCYGVNIGSANYTVSGNCIRMNIQTGTPGTESNKNITYSCSLPDDAYNATSSLQNATDTVPSFIPIIVIVVIGGILLSLVALLRNR